VADGLHEGSRPLLGLLPALHLAALFLQVACGHYEGPSRLLDKQPRIAEVAPHASPAPPSSSPVDAEHTSGLHRSVPSRAQMVNGVMTRLCLGEPCHERVLRRRSAFPELPVSCERMDGSAVRVQGRLG